MKTYLTLLSLLIISGIMSVADFEERLESTTSIERLTLDELLEIVGPAWGCNVSREGIVTLTDGTFDLAAVVAA